MVKIINPFRGADPVAQAFAGLGKHLVGDSMTPLDAEKLRALQRQNVETENLMRLITEKGGVQNLGADPVAQALALAAGIDAGDYGGYGTIGAATGFGSRDQRTTDWLTGTGRYPSSPDAFDRTKAQDQAQFEAEQARLAEQSRAALAEDARQFNVTPMESIVNGAPVFTPRADVFKPGIAPVVSEADVKGTKLLSEWGNLGALPPAEQRVLGADAAGAGEGGSVFNYVVPDPANPQNPKVFLSRDGVHDAQTGALLPPGGYRATAQGTASDVGLTNSARTQNQNALISNKKFNALIDMALPLTQDPSLFGPVGFIRSKAQDIIQSIGGAQEVLGAQNALTTLTDEAGNILGPERAKALLPELYDPRLPEVETLWGLIVYSGASALAGQENRSVSDKDVLLMRDILGDPHSFFASSKSMATKLEIARRVVGQFDSISRDALGGGAGAVAPAAPAATPPALAPVDTPPAPASDGIPTVATPAEAMKLPPGTKFRTPDGKVKVRP